MQLADAYRLLGLSPGATEPEVRQAHDQHQWHWHGDKHNQNPQASQYAYARRAELAVCLDMIHRAGFPDATGAPRMGSYGTAPPAPCAPPAPYSPQAAPRHAYQPQQGVEVAWQPHHGPLPMPVAPPPMPVDAARAHKRSQGTTQMLVGAGLVILGIVITSVTHGAAVSSGGGTYVVAYGPIVFGVIRFFQGLFNVMSA